MSVEDDADGFSTVEIRKNLKEAFGRAHFQNDVVRVSHHGKPYVAVVSDADAKIVEAAKPFGDSLADLVIGMKGQSRRHVDAFTAKIQEMLGDGIGLDEVVARLEESENNSAPKTPLPRSSRDATRHG
jgi:hypothetical protein